MAVNPNPPAAPVELPAAPPVSSDATKNTDTTGQNTGEHMIPKSRLDEESTKRKAAETELSTLRAEKAERERKEQEAQDEQARQRGEFEKLATTEKTRAAKLESDLTAEREARKADRVRYEVLSTAQRLGMVDPDAAYVLLDRAQVQFGEDGVPTNVEALLKDLLKAKPYLQGQANGAAAPKGAPTSPRPAGGGNDHNDAAARAQHAQMYRGL